MSITFCSEHPDFQLDNQDKVKVWLATVVRLEKYILGEIIYTFVNNARILEVNITYLNHHYYTDVITFDTSFLNKVEGEIFISIDTVKENAVTHSFGDLLFELNRTLVHGLLHLMAYDDVTDSQKKIMRAKEDYYLSLYNK